MRPFRVSSETQQVQLNDRGDEVTREFYLVTDGLRRFECERQDDAQWLCDQLNKKGAPHA